MSFLKSQNTLCFLVHLVMWKSVFTEAYNPSNYTPLLAHKPIRLPKSSIYCRALCFHKCYPTVKNFECYFYKELENEMGMQNRRSRFSTVLLLYSHEQLRVCHCQAVKNVIKVVFGIRFTLTSPYFSHDSLISPPFLYEQIFRATITKTAFDRWIHFPKNAQTYFCHSWKFILRNIKNTKLMINKTVDVMKYEKLNFQAKVKIDFFSNCDSPMNDKSNGPRFSSITQTFDKIAS